MAQLGAAMTGHRTLTHVDLSWNYGAGGKQAAAALATCLTDNVRLTRLCLAGCALRDDGTKTTLSPALTLALALALTKTP